MIELRQSSKDLGMAEYEMLQGIENGENGFMNEVYGMTYEEYKKWLADQDDFSQGKNLPQGWVPSTTYFLYDNDIPIGIGRVRHETSEYLQTVVGAGEIGYGISKNYRGKGYGNILFKEILKKCKDFGYDKITLFPHKDNEATIKIMLKNGGKIIGKFKEEKIIIEMPTKEKEMIETDRFILRKITLSDAEDIFEYAKDEDTGPRAGWTPHKNIEETKGLIEMWIAPDCKEEQFVIYDKTDKKVIGTMGLTIKEQVKDVRRVPINELILAGKKIYEIGITVSKKYWGKGVGTETLKAMIDFLFESRNADVVITCHFAENIGSKKVQEKNNMRILGQYERDDKWYNTECRTMIIRAKTREEWLNEKSKELTKG